VVTLKLWQMSILKSGKKLKIVQILCFSIEKKTRKLSALLTSSSKKHQCEDRSVSIKKSGNACANGGYY